MDKRSRDIMALSFVPHLGVVKIKSLLEKAGSTQEIFSMTDPEFYDILGGKFSDFARIRKAREDAAFIKELEYIEKEGIKVASYGSRDYPVSLRHIYDAPALLYYKGRLEASSSETAVAIVGSRKCSAYGRYMAERLASDLAERGVTVVSGMARGIDSAAHRGALKAGGRTVAVMGSSFRHIYPQEAGRLLAEICQKGAVVTEYPSGVTASKWTFPRRNRIISGMSRGVLVAEAAKKSGAMITVDFALEQGREVFAVPARADMPGATGSNLLIQSGAKLVMCADDILDELGMNGVGAENANEKISI